VIINLTAQSLRDEFLGRVCLTGADERCLLNQRLARLKPSDIHAPYLFWVLKSQLFRSFVRALNTGSLIQHMFTSQLDEFLVPVPPPGEQVEIAKELDRRMSLVGDLDRTLIRNRLRAEALREAVLQRAFNGAPQGFRASGMNQ
jgi:type I restriction enzyme S subunit